MCPQASLVSSSEVCQVPNSQGDGVQVGAASASLVGFYGATPIVQPAGYGSVTDSSGGTAAATNGIQTITGTYNSAILSNAIATLAAQTNALEAKLVALGLLSV